VILVDSNSWIHHLRRKDARLAAFLVQQRVHTCDVVIGELLLGSELPRTFGSDLLALPRLPSPSAAETRAFIESHRQVFARSGVGWADAQIVLCAVRSGARIHSSDKAVRRVCHATGVVLA
jgi:predicted nucleic acid-binding protein